MTMPSDADAAVESHGSNDGPRDHAADNDAVQSAHVDEENVPHPPKES